MKTLKEIVLVTLMLVPLAELVFLPWYLAQRTTANLNICTSSCFDACADADSSCPMVGPESQ